VTSRKILAEIRELRLESRQELAHIGSSIDEMRAENRAGRERTDELIARNSDVIARNSDLFEEVRDAMRLNREAMRRNEIAFVEGTRVVAEGTGVLSQLVETVREMKAEVQAQTRAIFKLIDRLDGGSAGPLPQTG
jgi:hypothetical protein